MAPLRRRPPPPPPPPPGEGPEVVDAPWVGFVARAEAIRGRLGPTLAGTAPGPRLDALRMHDARIGDIVRDVAVVAADGQRLARALAGLDPDGATAAHKEAVRALGALGDLDPDRAVAEARAEAARARYQAVHRVWNRVEDLAGELELALARLELAAAQVVELAVLPAGDPAGPAAELASLVDDLATLHRAVIAVDEVEPPPPPR